MKLLVALAASLLACLGHAQTVSVIGNTGLPTTTAGKVPFLLSGITVDSSNKIYTVHDWDEAQVTIRVWDPLTGKVLSGSGHVVPELCETIAVESDGSYAYVGSWHGTENPPNFSLDIWKVRMTGTPIAVNFTTAGQKIQVDTGSTTGLLPIVLSGNDLWVADHDGNKLLEYDKNTGSLLQTISVPSPLGLAVDGSGNIWVSTNLTNINVYSPSGTLLGTPITNRVNIYWLAINGARLEVWDSSNAVIWAYTISGVTATYINYVGLLETPGDPNTHRCSKYGAIALDSNGHLIISNHIGISGAGGSRLESLQVSNYGAIWKVTDTEFSSNAAYTRANPNQLLSSNRQAYSINRTTQTSAWLGCGQSDTTYWGAINAADGQIKALTLGSNDFLFFPHTWNGCAIYRVIPQAGIGPKLQLASCLGLSNPGADGSFNGSMWMWSWQDTTGTDVVPNGPGLTIDQRPPNATVQVSIISNVVDEQGTIWLSLIQTYAPPFTEDSAVWKVPLNSINSAGNPVYHWADRTEVISESTLRTAFNQPRPATLNVMQVTYSPVDNLIYTLLYIPALPGAAQNGGTIWMAGDVLAAWTPSGMLVWSTIPTYLTVGMTCVSGGSGVLIGQNVDNSGAVRGGVIHRYASNGVLLATYMPPTPQFGTVGTSNNPSGRFDEFGALNAQKAPNGTIDIFAEDNINGRVFWYNQP